MLKQLRLSLALFSVFVVILLGLPLVNFYFPAFANTHIWGFTGSWFFLGVLFYPLTWVVAYIYVKLSLDLEHSITKHTIKFKGGQRQ